MNVTVTVELERELGSVYAECEARVSKHFGRLEVSDFYCELKLTPDEQERCYDALKEQARHDSGLSIPEEEPEGRRCRY